MVPQTKKKRVLFGSYTEGKRKVFCFFGIKIKLRSRYRELRARIEVLEETNKVLSSYLCKLDKLVNSPDFSVADKDAETLKKSAPSDTSRALESRVEALEQKVVVHNRRLDAQKNDYAQKVRELARDVYYKIRKYSSPEKYAEQLKDWYYEAMGVPLNLESPETYNEKVQWLKLYDSTPLKSQLADKLLVRPWVEEKIGKQYLIPLLGSWNSYEEIDFSSLPKCFVLKCNHGCAYNIVVKDKDKLDMALTERRIKTWLNDDYTFRCGFELHYSAITPKVIAEQFIENKITGGDLWDYKFWCFDGKVKYIQFLSERNTNGLKMAFYDRDWNKQNFVYSYPLDTKDIEKPDNLDEMIEIAEKLAAGFCHVRVDLYRMDDGQIYFGEMTFTSFSGVCKWKPESMNKLMGDLITLPQKSYTHADVPPFQP